MDFSETLYENRIAFGILVVVVIWVIGGLFYYEVEKFSALDAFYFAATTLTTVGFGDLHPKTPVGKIFTVAYVFIGLGVTLYVLTQLGRYYLEKSFERSQRFRNARLQRLQESRERRAAGK